VTREVPIRGQMIRLGQLLKLAGVLDSGAEVKQLLSSEPVWVNGEREQRRGRQLHPGDVVRVGPHELRLTSVQPDGSVTSGREIYDGRCGRALMS
jgi:ribosome-associated protein